MYIHTEPGSLQDTWQPAQERRDGIRQGEEKTRRPISGTKPTEPWVVECLGVISSGGPDAALELSFVGLES